MTRLCDVFNGWNRYQTSLVHAIEPLSGDQLAWNPSERVRSIGELIRHIAMGVSTGLYGWELRAVRK
jgi:hypothetical protein